MSRVNPETEAEKVGYMMAMQNLANFTQEYINRETQRIEEVLLPFKNYGEAFAAANQVKGMETILDGIAFISGVKPQPREEKK
jgi:hypothetical protein